MTSKLKIIPLGGLDEIGKNMTVYEFGSDIIVVDCGMGFPKEDMYGIDNVLPDITYLKDNASKIRALFLTHGHEDHIGAIAQFVNEINAPIYTLSLTAALIELKLEEQGLLNNTQIFTKKDGDVVRLGAFTVEFIHVNHSIPDSVALAIKTPVGTVIQTGDFKIDVTPVSEEMMDLVRLGELGREGVLALLSDSTNVEKTGYTMSERMVGKSFEKAFNGCSKRIIITTFASNVHRLQQIIDVAAKYGRKVAVTGRSMENIMHVCEVLGYMKIPEKNFVSLEELSTYPKSKSVIISTGSQGETMSALYKMAFSGHKTINIDANDRVIISASASPGNENMISRVIDELCKKGAEVIYSKNTELHVSGHASQEEQKMVIALTKPKYFVPVHGETRMLMKHAELAKEMGIPSKNICIAENGSVIEFGKKGMTCEEKVTAGGLLMDGTSSNDVGSVVMRDRKRLAEDGMVVVILTISEYDYKLITDPDITTRGFIHVKESEELMDEMKRIAFDAAESVDPKSGADIPALKTRVKNSISNYLVKTTKRNPMVIPVIVQV